jgi:histidinol-phosphate aminotransferase
MQNRDAVSEFWARCRSAVQGLPRVAPDAWAFGAMPQHADSLLQLVLAGIKTATASALWDYEASGDPLPEKGSLSIILDGAGHPRALIETTDVTIMPFADVDAEHAFALAIDLTGDVGGVGILPERRTRSASQWHVAP